MNMKSKYEKNQLVEVKVLGEWQPAYVESDEGGGWYMCRMAFRSDMFSTGNMRPAEAKNED